VVIGGETAAKAVELHFLGDRSGVGVHNLLEAG